MSAVNDAIATNPSSGSWTEPESPANSDNPPQYPYNNVTQTESGHTLEMDDTPGQERIRLQHRAKTFIEMHANGDEVHKIVGTGYEIVTKGKNVQITGICNITINGDANIHVTGNKTERIDGNYDLQVNGNMTTRCLGSDGLQLLSDNDMTIASKATADGALYISAGDHVYVASDLQVGGAISADTINAESRINAGTGLYAGPQGVYSLGSITSLISVTAPLGKFAIMDAVLMSDTINSNIYNYHIHPAPRGFTGTPLTHFFGI
jgi:hypothetical protein